MTHPAHPPHVLPLAGAAIEYTDRGDGPAILLLHGGVFGGWFAPVADGPTLDGFRVIRVIRAGYTAGPAPLGHVTIADHAAHCAALLDTLGIEHADILAHSSGSVIALQLALDRSELVDSLMLVEPPLIDPLAAPEDVEPLRAALGPVIGGAIAAATSGDLRSAFDAFMSVICGRDYRTILAATLGADGLARAEQGCGFFFTDEMQAVAEWPFGGHLAAEIGQPVLLVQGGASPPPVHRLVAHLATMIPHAQVATIDGENHLLPLGNPAALARVITDFARRHHTQRPLV
ncbi:MAG TPA: alpha/beta hydrolase [Aldersonia sp.]